MTARQRPTRAREKELEAHLIELVAALDQQTFRRLIFRHPDRVRQAMRAARQITPPREIPGDSP